MSLEEPPPDNAGPVRQPYRPVPRDFEEKWPQHGWTSGKEYWRCHSRTLERWIDECGRARLTLLRKRYVEAMRTVTSRARRKRYVMGRTLSSVGEDEGLEKTVMPNTMTNNDNDS
jgi:hypothetical protein